VQPKRWLVSTTLHGETSQKSATFILIAVRNGNLNAIFITTNNSLAMMSVYCTRKCDVGKLIKNTGITFISSYGKVNM
jgi:hypothetical protein